MYVRDSHTILFCNRVKSITAFHVRRANDDSSAAYRSEISLDKNIVWPV